LLLLLLFVLVLKEDYIELTQSLLSFEFYLASGDFGKGKLGWIIMFLLDSSGEALIEIFPVEFFLLENGELL
jgi:hypothetical protein